MTPMTKDSMKRPTYYLIAEPFGAAYWMEDGCLVGTAMLINDQPDWDGGIFEEKDATAEELAAIRLGLDALEALTERNREYR